MKANQEIYRAIKGKGLFCWQVAHEIGQKDSNFTRMLRFELSEEKRQQIQQAIEKLSKEAANNG